jgi:hypothetical protein
MERISRTISIVISGSVTEEPMRGRRTMKVTARPTSCSLKESISLRGCHRGGVIMASARQADSSSLLIRLTDVFSALITSVVLNKKDQSFVRLLRSCRWISKTKQTKTKLVVWQSPVVQRKIEWIDFALKNLLLFDEEIIRSKTIDRFTRLRKNCRKWSANWCGVENRMTTVLRILHLGPSRRLLGKWSTRITQSMFVQTSAIGPNTDWFPGTFYSPSWAPYCDLIWW